MPKGCVVIADLLRKEDIQAALENIQNFSLGAQWLLTANTELVKENDIVEINGLEIQEFLLEINNGLEIQDFVLVADLFEYEIAPFFEEKL